MPRSDNQKRKPLYILKLLIQQSDEKHPVSMPEIIEYLDRQGISAERKSVYSDLRMLEELGYDIIYQRGRTDGGYYLASREFELAELKLLVDAVLASKFITAKKTKELIEKLGHLASVNEAGQLRRQVYVDRIKNDNESIYYTVDEIHTALQENRQISFTYYNWGIDKQLHARRDGKSYVVSPYYLIWKGEYYYLVAFDSGQRMTRYYRVDKIKELKLLDAGREGMEITGRENPVLIAERDFSMYAGREEVVTMEFSRDMLGVIIDRFGKDITIRPADDDLFSTHVTVSVSPQFFGWLTGLSGKVRLKGPADVRQEYLDYLGTVLDQY